LDKWKVQNGVVLKIHGFDPFTNDITRLYSG